MSKASSSKHPHLTAEELAEFREIFNLVDLDKGGTISKEELRQLMNTLGLKPTQEELNSMVEEIDTDGNGEIDFDGARHPSRPTASPLGTPWGSLARLPRSLLLPHLLPPEAPSARADGPPLSRTHASQSS